MLALDILSEAGPNGSLSWLFLWGLGFFFLIVIIGWLASRKKAGKSEARHEAQEQPHKNIDEPVKAKAKNSKAKAKRRK